MKGWENPLIATTNTGVLKVVVSRGLGDFILVLEKIFGAG
jgi:hypothetical protein